MNMKETARVWLAALLGWIVLTLLCWLLYPPTMSDTMSRYAPMADAFARGEWQLAFHPRFGVLFQCVAGSLAFLGLPGDVACQATAIGMLMLAGVAMWFVSYRLFGREAAWWTFALVVLCDVFLGNAMDGLRDPVKCLSFALLGLGIVDRRGVWFGLGLFVLITLVSYGFAVGCASLLFWLAWQVVPSQAPVSRWSAILIPTGFLLLGTFCVTVMVWAYSGEWVPAPQFIPLVERFL